MPPITVTLSRVITLSDDELLGVDGTFAESFADAMGSLAFIAAVKASPNLASVLREELKTWNLDGGDLELRIGGSFPAGTREAWSGKDRCFVCGRILDVPNPGDLESPMYSYCIDRPRACACSRKCARAIERRWSPCDDADECSLHRLAAEPSGPDDAEEVVLVWDEPPATVSKPSPGSEGERTP